jgi:hypothetical protein
MENASWGKRKLILLSGVCVWKQHKLPAQRSAVIERNVRQVKSAEK